MCGAPVALGRAPLFVPTESLARGASRVPARGGWRTAGAATDWQPSAGRRAIEWVDGVRRDPLDSVAGAPDRSHLHLDEELGPREPGDATAERRRAAAGEPGRARAVGAIDVGAVNRKDAPADDVVERGACLLERPANRLVSRVGLPGPVPNRLRLAGRVHRRAAADPDRVADLHRPRVAAGLLASELRVDITARP